MKRKLIALLVLCIFSVFSHSVFAQTGSNAEQDVKNVIAKYFDNYFKSFVILEDVNSDEIIESNDNTYLYGKIHEAELARRKDFGTGYKNYDVKLKYVDVDVQKNTAKVNLLMNLDYQYKNAEDVKSALYNVDYVFDLKLVEGKWVISKVETNFDEYQSFKQEVNKKVKNKDAKNLKEATNLVFDEKIKDLKIMKEKGAKDIKDRPVQEAAPISAQATFSYNATNGRAWAQRFAEALESSRFFYTAGNDCTNFVSQCVWAAYGGYVPSNDTQTKNNIANKVRMVPNVWHGGTGGGMPNWESVTYFWNYVTGSKTTGPVGTGYNNNGVYTNLSTSSIAVGQVLQARNGSSGSYGHSVYVTDLLYGPPGPGQTWWDFILISQHSSDKWNRVLSDLIANWGGSSCNLRQIKFSSANFSS